MSLTQQECEDIAEATRLLDEAYADYFARGDGYSKSEEGGINIYLGNATHRRQGRRVVEIAVYSYVFARGRREEFESTGALLEWAKEVQRDQLATCYDDGCDYGGHVDCTEGAQ